MKKLSIFIFIVLSIQLLARNKEVKTAFAEGIKSAVEVLKYEKNQQDTPPPKGYCLQLLAPNQQLSDSELIKMESLALYLGFKPAFLSSSEKKILCLSVEKDVDTANKKTHTLHKKYPGIEKYLLKINILTPKLFHREIPSLGITIEDYSVTANMPVALELNSSSKWENQNVKVISTSIEKLLIIKPKGVI